MVNLRVTRWAPIVLLALTSFASAQNYHGRELVHAELVADTSAIVAGKPLTVGLLLRMAPAWHTYWRYSGDAGLPTEIKWDLPAGWKAGEIQWPLPHKMLDPGDILTYGYADEVLLLQEITPPPNIAQQSITLNAEASWLVCEKLCIPGSAKLQLTLPVGTQASPANEQLFTRYRNQLPQPWPAGNIAQTSWSRTGSDVVLTINSATLANYSAVDFFPLPEPNVVIGHPAVERGSGRVTVRIPVESANVSKLNGVVIFSAEENSAARNGWMLDSTAAVAAGTGATPIAGGLAKFLLFGFIGGFILNLMPCVLPVISLKIFGFIQQAGQSRRNIFRSGAAFVGGIFAWFAALALLLIGLKNAGHEITWGAFQFSSVGFLLGMSVMVLVFALNLFGVFEITLPQRASRGAFALGEREGYAGSFFQGVFATVLATPCTAPFLGSAIGFAFTQPSFVIFIMFMAVAGGMGLPYLLLAAEPRWLAFLPKPGAWMEHIKQFMGFLLLGTLLFLLWVLGAERGVDAVIWASCFLLAVSVVCWIRGTFVTPVASMRTRAVAVAFMVLIAGLSGWYFIGKKFPSAGVAAAAQPTGDWQPFTPERVVSEQARGNSVFVDFTAAWCLSCKFNEATVLETAAVRDAFQRAGVVKLKADWTNADPAITKILKQFGRPGVPLYVLYPAGADKQPIVFPELLTKTMVLEKLQSLQPNVAAQ
ncbi:MAG: protein-disulfide reductase DsbD family protein [Chthoniobacterales bacterium]